MFCQSCGTQVAGAFCTKCGARAVQPQPVQSGGPPTSYQSPQPPPQQDSPPAPPQRYALPPQSYGQPLPPPAKSGSGLKILFIVLGVIAFLGMLGIGALWYGWHMVKQAASSHGVDLNAIAQSHEPGRPLDACELLTKDDLSQILKFPVERSESNGRSMHSTCRYYSSQASQRGSDQAAEALKKIQEATGKTNPSSAEQDEMLKNLGTMIRGMSGTVAGASNGQVLSIEVDSENGRAAMVGYKIGLGIPAALVGKDADPKVRHAIYDEVKGVGDEAVFGRVLNMFIVRKGDVAVRVDATTLPSAYETDITIAKRIVSKL